jgi:hypothetical protein
VGIEITTTLTDGVTPVFIGCGQRPRWEIRVIRGQTPDWLTLTA